MPPEPPDPGQRRVCPPCSEAKQDRLWAARRGLGRGSRPASGGPGSGPIPTVPAWQPPKLPRPGPRSRRDNGGPPRVGWKPLAGPTLVSTGRPVSTEGWGRTAFLKPHVDYIQTTGQFPKGTSPSDFTSALPGRPPQKAASQSHFPKLRRTRPHSIADEPQRKPPAPRPAVARMATLG